MRRDKVIRLGPRIPRRVPLPRVVRKVKRDASFDVISEPKVSRRGQGHVQNYDYAHANIESLGEAFRLPHLVFQRKNLQINQRKKLMSTDLVRNVDIIIILIYSESKVTLHVAFTENSRSNPIMHCGRLRSNSIYTDIQKKCV